MGIVFIYLLGCIMCSEIITVPVNMRDLELSGIYMDRNVQ